MNSEMTEEHVAHFGCGMTLFYWRDVGVVGGLVSGSVGGCRGLTGERVLKSVVWLSLLMAPSPLLNANVHNCQRLSDVRAAR